MLSILVLAAGQSTRMRGADKLLQPVGGTPLIRVICERALQTGHPVIAVLPTGSGARLEALEDLEISTVQSADSARGMAYSIRAGMEALPPQTRSVMILPADMPDIDATDLQTMISAREAAPTGSILRGTSQDGRPGHPVIFPRDCFDQLHRIEGDQGAHLVVAANMARMQMVPLPKTHALTDLDTPEDWAAWLKQQG